MYPPSCFLRASGNDLISHQHSQKYFYQPFLHILLHNSNTHLGIVMVLQQELDQNQANYCIPSSSRPKHMKHFKIYLQSSFKTFKKGTFSHFFSSLTVSKLKMYKKFNQKRSKMRNNFIDLLLFLSNKIEELIINIQIHFTC